MKKFMKLALMSLVAVWAITGCQNPTGSNQDQGEGARGSLTVSMNDAVSRSILPGISMNPASYDLVGAGPNGASFSQSVTGGNSLTLSDLAFGAWTVTVTAKNGSGTPIGQGNGTVTVMSNASASLSITVRPYDGFGTLALNVSWPAAQVQTAQIQSTLTPANGTARDLAFTVNGSAGTASLTASDVATGYHTLVLKLLDNGHLAIGAVEVVRIVKDQTSSGTLAFTNVNQSTGTLEVNVTPEMSDPLEVSISGSAATKPANKSLSLSAAVSNYSDNVTYVWYVNGDAKATGASYSFDDSWAKGFYRIDVTAYSADGKRAGSATTNVQVVEAVTGGESYSSGTIGALLYVPSGTFQRDEYPTNTTTVSAFRIGQYEITRAQYQAIMGTDPSETQYSSGTTDPVQKMNWYQAIAFCNKLSLAEGLNPVYSLTVKGTPINWSTLTYAQIPTANNTEWDRVTATWTNNGYRLPTEMEWMWAAMGGPNDRANGNTGTGINTTGYLKTFAGSTGSNARGDYAVVGYRFEIDGTKTNRTNPVGSKKANELGLYDMSGNVMEWCWDWVSGTIYETGPWTDYRGLASSGYRAFRGGSWGSPGEYSAVGRRDGDHPEIRSASFGIRVVRL